MTASSHGQPLASGKRLRCLFVTAPLCAVLGFTSWARLAFTGWGYETAPGEQLARDAVPLTVSAVAGSAAVAVTCGALRAGLRSAVLGAVPALAMVSAYLTDLY